jgi:hypothetical protein
VVRQACTAPASRYRRLSNPHQTRQMSAIRLFRFMVEATRRSAE